MTIRVVVGETTASSGRGSAGSSKPRTALRSSRPATTSRPFATPSTNNSPTSCWADIQMPPTKTDEGIRLAALLRTTHPGGVVILSQYAEPLYATELLKRGSDRRIYLLKERVQHREEVTHAVREVAEGRSVVDSGIIDLLVRAKRNREDAGFEELTPVSRRFSPWSPRAGATQASPSSSAPLPAGWSATSTRSSPRSISATRSNSAAASKRRCCFSGRSGNTLVTGKPTPWSACRSCAIVG